MEKVIEGKHTIGTVFVGDDGAWQVVGHTSDGKSVAVRVPSTAAPKPADPRRVSPQ